MNIRNATPMHYMDGMKDESAGGVFPEPKGLSQFQPLIISHAVKGPYGEFECTGKELEAIFGLDTINPLSKFYTHQTHMASKILKAGGVVSFKRLQYINSPRTLPYNVGDPDDTNGIANIAYYLVITDEITRKPFLRNQDGTVEMVDGVPQEDPNGDDIQVKYAMLTAKYIPQYNEDTQLSSIMVEDGMTIFGQTVDITAYPLFVVPAEAHGEYYNNIGVALTVADDIDMVTKGMFPFQFSLVDKSTGRAKIHTTINEAKGAKFTFRPDSSHPLTNASVTFEDLIPHDFGNYTDADYEVKPYTIGDVRLLRNYVSDVTMMVSGRELEGYNGVLPGYSDYSAGDVSALLNEQYLANIVDFKHSNGALFEYTRYAYSGVLSDQAKAAVGVRVQSTMSTPTYMQGGYDGAVFDNDAFEAAIVTELKDGFGDPASRLNNMAISRFSTFIDTGFSAATKTEFGVVLSNRKDLNLIGATAFLNKQNKKQENDEAISMAAILNSMYSIYTESELYNTPTFRYCIVMGSGLSRHENYRYHLPLTYDFVYKNVRMFGGKDGKWNTKYEFSARGGNNITEQTDIYPDFVPDTIKNKLWTSNLIWPQGKDKQTWIYPAMQTGYNDDTSVANGWYSVIADCYAQKVLNETFLYLVGDQVMTRTEYKDEFIRYASAMLSAEHFGNIIEAKVVLHYTKEDEQRGYSAHAYVELYVPNMKTVINSHVVMKRIDNLV